MLAGDQPAATALPVWRYRALIPAAALTGGPILVSGQILFERLLVLQSTLGGGVEFSGGLLFLFLILGRHMT